jgi:hypothetical protein
VKQARKLAPQTALDVGIDKCELFAALDPSMYARRIGQLYGSISVRYVHAPQSHSPRRALLSQSTALEKLGHAPAQWDGLDWRQFGRNQPAIDAGAEISQASLFQESISFLSRRQSKCHLPGTLSFVREALAKGDFMFSPVAFHGSCCSPISLSAAINLAMAQVFLI